MKRTILKLLTLLFCISGFVCAAPSASAAETYPTLVSAIRGGYSVTVTWKLSGYTGMYRIFRRTADEDWITIADVYNTSYSDTSVKEGTTYTYTVRCVNSAREVTGPYDEIGLTVSTGNFIGLSPEIIEHPKNINITKRNSQNVTFAVKTKGHDLQFQWQYRANESTPWALLTGDDFSGTESNKISLDAALYMDGWQFRCVASNSEGVVCSDAAVLHIKDVQDYDDLGNLQWVVNQDVLRISGNGAMEKIIINSPFSAWGRCKNIIKAVEIESGVTNISENAFYGCRCLTSVTIPDSVTSIGSSAFQNCSGLTSVTIPESVTSIGDYAFYNCGGLTSVMIPESVTSIGDSVFSGCSGLTSVTIPESVTSIGDRAFSYCSGLTSVTIPESVTSIGDSAFSGCGGLTSVTIPESVTSIGDRAFSYCSGLTSVTIPESVTSIGDSAFYSCSGLTSVTIPESVTSIGDSAFSGCGGLTSMTIPESVTSIGDSAFSGCGGLTSVTIPENVTNIGESAFADCNNLTSIYVDYKNGAYSAVDGLLFDKERTELLCCPAGRTGVYKISGGVTSIGNAAFHGCRELTSMTIPESVRSIGDSAFSGCSGLTSVMIPDSVASIGKLAFSDCSGLTSVTIPDSVTSIGESAFSGCSGLTSIIINDENKMYSAVNGILFNKERTEILYCPRGQTGEYIIPESVTSIGNRAFERCSGLTSVTIPDSVTSIGESAFSGCRGLTSVKIPDSVTSIGERAFERCSGLTSVAIPGSVESIGERAFERCSGLTSIKIAEGVMSIGERAFSDCSGLTSVTIPDSVTSIGWLAFDRCRGLTICGEYGSAAHRYAYEHGSNFMGIDFYGE